MAVETTTVFLALVIVLITLNMILIIGKVLGMVVGFMVWAMSILMLIFTELMGAQNTHWMICSIGREHGMVDM